MLEVDASEPLIAAHRDEPEVQQARSEADSSRHMLREA